MLARCANFLILPCHLTVVVAEVVFFVNGHYVRLCGDHDHVVTILFIVVHGAVVEVESVVLVVNVVSTVGVHEDAQTLYANAAEDAEHFTLVIVEFGGCLAAKGEKIVAKESLDASEREVGQAGAVVEERMDALFMSVTARDLSWVGHLRLGRGWYSS